MYVKIGIAAGGAGAAAALPFTGGLNLLWIALASFTLVAAAGALLRILPSWHRR